ncbi:hypothetical protein JR311_20180 (plasmid) [Bacillus velezensis]|uniref:hypothetical protein n=1 Tax=Bacillus velezensis TaxID=492670 RepID=UPI0019599D93|nr:hypothetical protein [Bacillus velezensis]QRV11345.1 hypothetical protein JR311_20180 [Bacillus velezensis]
MGKNNDHADLSHMTEGILKSIEAYMDGIDPESTAVNKEMIGYVTMWTTLQELCNMMNNKEFYGHNEKSKTNIVKISVPDTAIRSFEVIEGRDYKVLKFYCRNKDLWHRADDTIIH